MPTFTEKSSSLPSTTLWAGVAALVASSWESVSSSCLPRLPCLPRPPRSLLSSSSSSSSSRGSSSSALASADAVPVDVGSGDDFPRSRRRPCPILFGMTRRSRSSASCPICQRKLSIPPDHRGQHRVPVEELADRGQFADRSDGRRDGQDPGQLPGQTRRWASRRAAGDVDQVESACRQRDPARGPTPSRASPRRMVGEVVVVVGANEGNEVGARR